MHEGAGACNLVMDPKEEMAACWFVPFIGENWYSHGCIMSQILSGQV